MQITFLNIKMKYALRNIHNIKWSEWNFKQELSESISILKT